jgi:flagellar biosynthetic protein FliR
MAILNLPMDQIGLFIFVLVRVGAIVFSIPFLGSRNVPVLLKSSLAVAVAVMVVPQLKLSAPVLDENAFRLVIGLAGEVAMGLIIGLMFQLLISGIQLAGEIAGFQMGIALANVMDPTSSQQIPILSQFLNLFAMLMFLVFNMHHYFLKVLAESFNLIPPLAIQIDQALLPLVIQNAAHMFVVAIQLGAPVIVGLLLSSVALALIARTVPQVQIFVVAMPLKILLGLVFMAISLPFCTNYLFEVYREFGGMLISLLNFF